ncbi:MAG: hypothetical protein K2I25_04515, partial [Muribaculaceae bacterium]|nr:hypothetical protein [Muribaculaceae bacterium]
MDSLFRLDIKYLKGIGPARAQLLDKELGIKNYYDLLHHFPTHYIDPVAYTPLRAHATPQQGVR